jgi:ABC-type sugar transport system ATPase subunit
MSIALEVVMEEKRVLVEMKKIFKRFGHVDALSDVDLIVHENEIIGLVGDNGAGKSTLMKILAGVYRMDSGEIVWRGRKVSITDPSTARKLGIEVVYQDLALSTNVDAVANVFTGREIIKPGFFNSLFGVINQKAEEEKASQAILQLGMKLPSVRMPVKYLSGGQQQLVAIARAIYSMPNVLIMDEPTTAIAVKEKQQLLSLIPKFKNEGVSTIFISHTLQEVFDISDRIVVLSKGKKLGEGTPEELNMAKVMELMML